jgi:hypothetical protein
VGDVAGGEQRRRLRRRGGRHWHWVENAARPGGAAGRLYPPGLLAGWYAGEVRVPLPTAPRAE